VKPTPEQVERAAGALVPFVEEWKLALNPEDLEEIAYAVLVHHDSDASWEQIDAAVREQIAEVRRDHAKMLEIMEQSRRDDAD
jgi:hypothetical protein